MAATNLLLVLLVLVGCITADKPHIIFIMSDDYGWADVGYHNPTNAEIVTPNLNALHSSGIELDRHYAYQFCSPSRSALLTGRNPIHVNVYNLVQNYNPGNNLTGFAGIPLRMTLIGEKLKQAGYTTRHTGKWDVGFATTHHLPVNRGFDSSFGYMAHANDYWGFNATCGAIDLWSGLQPAHNDTPWQPTCSYTNQTGCEYEDEKLVQRVLKEIGDHDTSQPLFYYWAMHGVHNPLEPIKAYYDNFSSIDVVQRRMLMAMIKYMDESIGKVTDLIKAKGMWDNTLIVWASDNGGPPDSLKVAATNFPLRGGKTTNWEGGIRVNAFVTGGYVPAELRGTKSEDFVTMWDWYATFCGIVGVDPTDTVAAAYGLPPHDSYNIWPMLTKQNTTNPRTEIPIGLDNGGEPGVNVVVQGIIVPPYKLLVGMMEIPWWQGYVYPNSSTNIKAQNQIPDLNCTAGCLYNIMTDPGEVVDISAANPDVKSRLLARIQYHQGTVLAADRGNEDPAACITAVNKYGGFLGPWVEIDYVVDTTTTTTAAASSTTAAAATSTNAATTGTDTTATAATTTSTAADTTTASSTASASTATPATTAAASSSAASSNTASTTTGAATSGASSTSTTDTVITSTASNFSLKLTIFLPLLFLTLLW